MLGNAHYSSALLFFFILASLLFTLPRSVLIVLFGMIVCITLNMDEKSESEKKNASLQLFNTLLGIKKLMS